MRYIIFLMLLVACNQKQKTFCDQIADTIAARGWPNQYVNKARCDCDSFMHGVASVVRDTGTGGWDLTDSTGCETSYFFPYYKGNGHKFFLYGPWYALCQCPADDFDTAHVINSKLPPDTVVSYGH